MQYVAHPSSIKGHLQAPASKSAAQRAIAIASLATGTSVIVRPGNCDDVQAAIRVCKQLGVHIEDFDHELHITGGIKPPGQELNCGESGLGIRMFSGIAASLNKEIELTGRGSLMNRPMSMVEQSLHAMGVACKTNNGRLPLTITGPIPGGMASIDGSQSSQVLTGILIASAFAANDVILKVNDLKSKEYVDITTRIMKLFGVNVTNNNYQEFIIPSGQQYKAARYHVEGDWSGAAFLLVAGAIAGQMSIENLDMASSQPDRKIMEALQDTGAICKTTGNLVEVKKGTTALQAFSFDATHCPDLFPPLAALAANCTGNSRIRGVARLKSKESDRAATIMDTFGKLGITISLDGDVMIIKGGRLKGANIHSHGDHRIAMAGAIAALTAEGPVTIDHAEAINKSYPEFYKDLENCTTNNGEQ
jgi:3-phosphoshikimate 1-carboxyvinyltransferase